MGGYRALAVLTGVVLLAGGCGSSHEYQYTPPAGPDPVPVTTEPTTQPPQPVKPAGSVPQATLGKWAGGLGSKSDFTLTIVSTDAYQLVHFKTPALPAFVEQGWIVGDSDQLLLRPVRAEGITARERTVSWFRQPNSVGLDLLIVNDPVFGELDLVRDDA
jgi:hypothetical protein